MIGAQLGWFGVVRLGLVQTSLGAIVVLATSTINRVMVVELTLPAVIPGALVAFHYSIQMLRPRMGYGSDIGGRRVPWIIAGMLVLAAGGVMAASATALIPVNRLAGLFLAVIAYALVGVGVGASGTSLLVLLAQKVAPGRRAAAATLVWLMMFVGFVVTATSAGHFLDPFSFARLISVTVVVAVIAVVLTVLAVWGIEGGNSGADNLATDGRNRRPFMQALREVWDEPQARRFAIFVFASMLAYSAQELILEPFAGAVLHLTPGESAKLTGLQHGGALFGMMLVAATGSVLRGRLGSLRGMTMAGSLGSAAVLACLAAGAFAGPNWPIRPAFFTLGVANGIFAVSAIGAMMEMADAGQTARAGVRMGLWGAAQAVAFAIGGLIGSGASDLARHLLGSPAAGYAAVFLIEAALFLFAAVLALRLFDRPAVLTPLAQFPRGHR